MKRIILHWTAGKYLPNSCDLGHYHYLIDGNAVVHKGIFSPEDNEVCHRGKYAMHTGGGNTGSIGVAMCGMLGFQSVINVGDFPVTLPQFERTMKLCAELLMQFNITLSEDTVMTHYEFGQKHKNTTSFGKIDIIYIPPYPFVSREDVGAFIRTKVKWYLKKT